MIQEHSVYCPCSIFLHSHLGYCDFTMSLNEESLKIKKTVIYEETFNSKFKDELFFNFMISMAFVLKLGNKNRSKLSIILVKKKKQVACTITTFSQMPRFKKTMKSKSSQVKVSLLGYLKCYITD